MSTDVRGLPIVLILSLGVSFGVCLAFTRPGMAAPDQNQEPLCEDFHRDTSGSWIATRKVTLSGVTYEAGTAFPAGVTFAGKDWGALLDQKCK